MSKWIQFVIANIKVHVQFINRSFEITTLPCGWMSSLQHQWKKYTIFSSYILYLYSTSITNPRFVLYLVIILSMKIFLPFVPTVARFNPIFTETIAKVKIDPQIFCSSGKKIVLISINLCGEKKKSAPRMIRKLHLVQWPIWNSKFNQNKLLNSI